MLTAKFKKGDTQPPKGSRMEMGTKMKMPIGSFPDVEKYLKDEKYWTLRDAMQKMADSHGKIALNLCEENICAISALQLIDGSW